MGYSYENYEIFENFFEISQKIPKKFKNIETPKNTSDLKKELYFVRSPC